MLIANPIYDVVFKYLMEDNNIAKRIISIITGENIIQLDFRPQEKSHQSDKYPLTLYRMDFIATIETSDHILKKVLIEIQKARKPTDLKRFRTYLGENYKQSDMIRIDENNEEERMLPITTIYLLGYKLGNIESSAIKVNREYIDAITGNKIEERNEFIESLTHDAYIIQIPLLRLTMRTKLEKILSIFDQSMHINNDPFILDYNYEIDENTEDIVNRLLKAASTKEMKERIENEEELEMLYRLSFEEKDNLIRAKDTKIKEKDKKIVENAKMLEEKDKKLEEQERIIAELKRKLDGK